MFSVLPNRNSVRFRCIRFQLFDVWSVRWASCEHLKAAEGKQAKEIVSSETIDKGTTLYNIPPGVARLGMCILTHAPSRAQHHTTLPS